jgi:hypothetical protein
MPEKRRFRVPFDPEYFRKKSASQALDAEAVFTHIYESRLWEGSESASGEGSGEAQTARLREALPPLLRELGVETLLDLPCGDFGWMSQIELPVRSYIGGDIVAPLIERNQSLYGGPGRSFRQLNLIEGPLPLADLILVRDCWVHFSFDDIFRSLRSIRAAGIRWLLSTTFPLTEENEDIITGDWRTLNLERAPFGFPAPAFLLDEGCTEGGGVFADKSLALWELSSLPPSA